ncbi:FAD-dependent oxidoreductase [Arabiibacter massiliensis]|uniref:FAD-dependent oxidoreductase n=1 Tax=Arabiibacter massiliensis TaxID=1870985 RepID=UPI00155AA1FE|nr:FAD-dependent oxidoreductase [Arabiibacter massiliensis]
MKRNQENEGLTRRNFVTGGLVAAAVGAGALAGCAPQGKSDPSDSAQEWDAEADVVVVGCGAGLAAVLAAAESGAKVIGIEKNSTFGGNWAINQGVFYAAATDAMKANGDIDPRTGADDTIEGAYADWIEAAAGRCDPTLAKIVLEEQRNFINQLFAEGYSFYTEIPGSPVPVARGHSVIGDDGKLLGGAVYTSYLEEKCRQAGAELVADTTALSLIADDGGNVIGVEARSSGKKTRYKAKAVVVATGSYAANLRMRAQYNPETDGWGLIGGGWATGDGHRMLFDLDAAVTGHSTISPSNTVEQKTGGVYSHNMYSVFWTGPRSYLIADNTGKRNRDETVSYVQVDGKLLTVPSFHIFDQTQFDDEEFTLITTWSKSALASAVEDGTIAKADTVEELAAKLYLDKDVLQQTIDEFNEAARTGSDPFGRKAETMRELAPPYYGSTGTNGVGGTALSMCIKIDEDARVMDIHGKAIPGVYGGGNDMVFINYASENYIASGTGCSGGYAISTHAGRKAAEYALSRS